MKKRRVMRLLAVVMAAVVAVTSQGVPAGLTEVEAAVATQNGLTAGHLYQEVTATPHEHSDSCYNSIRTYKVAEADKYFKEITKDEYDSSQEKENEGKATIDGRYFLKISAGSHVTAMSGSAIESWITDIFLGENQFILKDSSEQIYKVYSGTHVTDDDTLQKIEAAVSGTPVVVGTEATVDGVKYTAVKNILYNAGDISWASGVAVADQQPSACYTIREDSIVLQTATIADPEDPTVTMDYTYKPISVSGGTIVQSEKTPVAEDKVIKNTSEENKYYIDVTDKYVTKIEANNKNVQPAVKTTTDPTDLDDSVTVTLGTGATAETEEVAKKDVTNNYDSGTSYAGGGNDVKITKIEGDTTYMYAEYDTSKEGQVIESEDNVKLISSVSDFSTIASYVDVTGLSLTVKTVTPPSATLQESNLSGTGYETKIDSKPTFDVTSKSVTVTKPSVTGDTTNWRFAWKDVTLNEEGGRICTAGSSRKKYDELGSYTITFDSDLVGHHKLTIEAFYNDSDTSFTISNELEFYVLGEVSVDAGISTFAKQETESEHKISLNSILSQYTGISGKSYGNLSGSFTSDKSEDIASATFDGSTNEVSFKLEDNAKANDTVTLTGTLTNHAYVVTVKVKVKIVANGINVKTLSLNPIELVYGDPVVWDTVLNEKIYGSEGATGYEVKFGDTEDGATDTKPTKAGTTNVYVSYSKDGTVGSGFTTVTIYQKALFITPKDQTIKQGESVSPTEYTITTTTGDPSIVSLPAGSTLTATIFGGEYNGRSDISNLPAGKYSYTYDVKSTDVVNYYIAERIATLIIKEGDTTTPASGNDKNGNSTTTDTTTPSTTEPTLTKNEDGDKVIVDADGKVIADELVTIDGKSYVTDENGEVLTSQIAEVGDVKVYVGKNGVVATDKAVTYEGKKYYATENGEIATNSFVITARGNKVYATKSGALKTSTAFTVNGKKYYAKASGVIATTGFVKTAKGNTVYATKSGALQVNKAFKASNGKKYVADKNGKIVKGKKITIGNKVYTTNKKGVIIKVTTKKK